MYMFRELYVEIPGDDREGGFFGGGNVKMRADVILFPTDTPREEDDRIAPKKTRLTWLANTPRALLWGRPHPRAHLPLKPTFSDTLASS